MSKVESFWCHEAKNIRCVRASDHDRVAQERDQLRVDNERLRADLANVGNPPAPDAELIELLHELRSSAACNGLHHKKSEQHECDKPCKVLARIDAKLAQLRTKGE